MLGQNLLCTGVLLGDLLHHLIVDNLRRSLGVWALELIFLIVVIANVWQSVAHSGVCNHSVGTLCGAFEVVHGTR